MNGFAASSPNWAVAKPSSSSLVRTASSVSTNTCFACASSSGSGVGGSGAPPAPAPRPQPVAAGVVRVVVRRLRRAYA
ncbi:hypothetical protein SBADM41S_09928 [Streptomyces badius]